MSLDVDERRRLCFAFPDLGTVVFIPVCANCGRFVKADDTITLERAADTGWCGATYEPKTPNALCRRCGRVAMIWEGFL